MWVSFSLLFRRSGNSQIFVIKFVRSYVIFRPWISKYVPLKICFLLCKINWYFNIKKSSYITWILFIPVKIPLNAQICQFYGTRRLGANCCSLINDFSPFASKLDISYQIFFLQTLKFKSINRKREKTKFGRIDFWKFVCDILWIPSLKFLREHFWRIWWSKCEWNESNTGIGRRLKFVTLFFCYANNHLEKKCILLR